MQNNYHATHSREIGLWEVSDVSSGEDVVDNLECRADFDAFVLSEERPKVLLQELGVGQSSSTREGHLGWNGFAALEHHRAVCVDIGHTLAPMDDNICVACKEVECSSAGKRRGVGQQATTRGNEMDLLVGVTHTHIGR